MLDVDLLAFRLDKKLSKFASGFRNSLDFTVNAVVTIGSGQPDLSLSSSKNLQVEVGRHSGVYYCADLAQADVVLRACQTHLDPLFQGLVNPFASCWI